MKKKTISHSRGLLLLTLACKVLKTFCKSVCSLSHQEPSYSIHLIKEKHKVLVCALNRFVFKVMENLDPLAKSSFKNLGVTFVSALTMDAHVNSLVCICVYHLQNIAIVRYL